MISVSNESAPETAASIGPAHCGLRAVSKRTCATFAALLALSTIFNPLSFGQMEQPNSAEIEKRIDASIASMTLEKRSRCCRAAAFSDRLHCLGWAFQPCGWAMGRWALMILSPRQPLPPVSYWPQPGIAILPGE